MPTTLERPDLREAPVEESDLLIEEAPPTEMPEREMLAPKKPIRWMRWTLAVVAVIAAAGIAFFALGGDGDETVSDSEPLADVVVPEVPAAEPSSPAQPSLIAPELQVPAFRGLPEPVSVTFISGHG